MLVCWYDCRLHLLVVFVTGRVPRTRQFYHIMSPLLHGPVVRYTAALMHLIALALLPACRSATSHTL